MGCHALLQGTISIEGLNPGLLHCRLIRYHMNYQRSPRTLEWIAYPFFRGTSCPKNWTGVSYIAGGFFTTWDTREDHHMTSVSSVQFSHSVVSNSSWPHGLQHAGPPCPSNSPNLLKLTAIESVIPSYRLILCRPLLLLLSTFPSIRVFLNE